MIDCRSQIERNKLGLIPASVVSTRDSRKNIYYRGAKLGYSSVKTISRIPYISTATKPFIPVDPSVNSTTSIEQFSFSRNKALFLKRKDLKKKRQREERKKERNIVRNDVLPVSKVAIVRRLGMAELGIGSFHEGSSFVEKFRRFLQVRPPLKI